MAYFKSQILPSKLTYRTVVQDEQISSDSAYVPVTFSTIQSLKYITVRLKQDRGGGTVYEGSATIPVSKISGSSAKVAQIYLNNNFSDVPFKINLFMSYTGASVDYSGTYYDMYITILGFPMDIFAPVSLVRTPFIMPSGAQKITLPLTILQWDKLETKMYADGTKTSSSKVFNIIGGNTWGAQTRSLCSRVNVGSWRLTYQFGNSSVDSVYFSSLNNKTTDILLENNGYTIDEIPHTGTVPTSMIEDTTVIFADDSHYDDGVALGRVKIYNSDVLIMDLVPINEFYNKYKLMDNTPLNTVYGWNAYPTGNRVDYAPQILTHVRIVLKYQDNSGTWHYSTPCFIAKESVNGGVTDIPFTDGGQITNIQLRPDKSQYIFHDISGATKDEFPIYADIRVCRDSKEGGFYDTIGNNYYFSETATPLVYTEL